MDTIFKIDVPSESTGFLLWKTTNLWQREIKRVLKQYDLTHTQFVVLASAYWLSKSNDNITQVEIANFIDIDKMMTSNVIHKLLDKKLIERKEHKTDTRAKVIRLTRKGIETLKKSLNEVESFDIRFFSILSDKEAFNGNLIGLLKNDKNDW